MTASHFTYPRDVIDDIANVIASVRQMTISTAQRDILDVLALEICHELTQYEPTFDGERFLARCRTHEGNPPSRSH